MHGSKVQAMVAWGGPLGYARHARARRAARVRAARVDARMTGIACAENIAYQSNGVKRYLSGTLYSEGGGGVRYIRKGIGAYAIFGNRTRLLRSRHTQLFRRLSNGRRVVLGVVALDTHLTACVCVCGGGGCRQARAHAGGRDGYGAGPAAADPARSRTGPHTPTRPHAHTHAPHARHSPTPRTHPRYGGPGAGGLGRERGQEAVRGGAGGRIKPEGVGDTALYSAGSCAGGGRVAYLNRRGGTRRLFEQEGGDASPFSLRVAF
jgi:hypothetical protein